MFFQDFLRFFWGFYVGRSRTSGALEVEEFIRQHNLGPRAEQELRLERGWLMQFGWGLGGR